MTRWQCVREASPRHEIDTKQQLLQRFELDGTGYATHMYDEATTQDPVIDLTSGASLDEVEHPYAAAEHVINNAV